MKSNYYLESSAAMKLFEFEQETDSLRSWLDHLPRDSRLITSSLTRLEVLGNLTLEAREAGRGFFRRITIVPVKQSILDDALVAMSLGLKTLDAIHFATAQRMEPDLVAVVSYDKQLTKVLKETGVAVLSPTG